MTHGWEGGTALRGLWAPFQPVLEGVDVGPVGTDLWLGWEEGLGDQRPGMGGSHSGQVVGSLGEAQPAGAHRSPLRL